MKHFSMDWFIVILAILAMVAIQVVPSILHDKENRDTVEEEVREEIYLSGYDAGYSDADTDFFEGYDYGYDEGYNEGYDEGYNEGFSDMEWEFEEAVDHARDYSEWHPEEAAMLIEEYQNGTGEYTEEEYLDAIESLYRFFEYLYYNMYE